MLYISFYWLYVLSAVMNPVSPDTLTYHIKTEEVWVFDHFEPEKDKIIGIWPRHQRYETSEEIKKLKNRYGFNYVLLPASLYRNTFTLLINNGYSNDNIMAQILPDNYKIKMNYYGTIFAYYLDEPNERGYSISGIKEEINRSAAGSAFIISGYRRTSGLTLLIEKSDGVMFSSYKHWWQCFPGVWCAWPVNYDQRDDWKDMKERYGKKSFMNWVGAHRDTIEYSDLLRQAADLKLPGVWFYQYEDMTNSEDNILSFCRSAWLNGYLKKYERKYIYEYRCYENISAECDSAKWLLIKKTATGDMKEVLR